MVDLPKTVSKSLFVTTPFKIFFVFESYIFEERCEWPLARDQQKAGKRIRHVEKKSEAVCVVVTLLPRKIDVFSKKKNCVSLLSM